MQYHQFNRLFFGLFLASIISITCTKFETIPALPAAKVETGTYNDAERIVSGSVISTGEQLIRYGHVWSFTGNAPKLGDADSDFKEHTSKLDTGYFETVLPELTAGERLYIRAFAEDKHGVVYGNIIQILLVIDPVISMHSATNWTYQASSRDFTLSVTGELEQIGRNPIRDKGFEISLDSSFTQTLGDPISLGGQNQTGVFNAAIPGTQPAVEYYIRAYVENELQTTFYSDPVRVMLTDVWQQLTTDNRGGSVSFSRGNHIYSGLGGFNMNFSDKFYAYDAELNTWDSIAPFAGGQRGCAGCTAKDGFVLYTNVNNFWFEDSWEYIPGTDTWEEAGFPGLQTASYFLYEPDTDAVNIFDIENDTLFIYRGQYVCCQFNFRRWTHSHLEEYDGGNFRAWKVNDIYYVLIVKYSISNIIEEVNFYSTPNLYSSWEAISLPPAINDFLLTEELSIRGNFNHDGLVYLVLGDYRSDTSQLVIYNPESNEWHQSSMPPVPQYFGGRVFSLTSGIYATGNGVWKYFPPEGF